MFMLPCPTTSTSLWYIFVFRRKGEVTMLMIWYAVCLSSHPSTQEFLQVGSRRIRTKGNDSNKMGHPRRIAGGLQSCQGTQDRYFDRRGSECEFVPFLPICRFYSLANSTLPFSVHQHKLGADRTETIQVVPVQSENRLKKSGPTRQIEVASLPWLAVF